MSWQGDLFGKVDCRKGGWDGNSMEVEMMFHFIIKKSSEIVPHHISSRKNLKGFDVNAFPASTKSTLTSSSKLPMIILLFRNRNSNSVAFIFEFC